MIPYGVQFCEEELDKVVDDQGNIKKIVYGIERIPDIMILKEMAEYREGVNVDRLIAFCALVAFIAVQQSNKGFVKRYENEEKKLEKSYNYTKLNKNPFTNKSSYTTKVGGYSKQSKAFKNLK